MRKEKYLKGTATMFDPNDVDYDQDGSEVVVIKWT
jgi:hypothetical protein